MNLFREFHELRCCPNWPDCSSTNRDPTCFACDGGCECHDTNPQFPKFYGRGPLQIRGSAAYAAFGESLLDDVDDVDVRSPEQKRSQISVHDFS